MEGRRIKVTYPLVFPFKLSYGTFYQRSSFIIELRQGEHRGYGEMSFVPYYGKKEAAIEKQLQAILSFLDHFSDGWTPEELHLELSKKLDPDSFLLSAIDCALYDLHGRIHDVPVWKQTGGSLTIPATSSLTITQDDWKTKLNWGWPVLKLKMGFEGDMDLLEEIRYHYHGPLRIDANSGWTVTDFLGRLPQLQTNRVDLVEQPVPREAEYELEGIDTTIPLAADESLQGIGDLESIAKIYQVVNIKLQKCGGITPALALIQKAKRLGLELMAGCMTESSVGIGAMAHLASHFDYLDLDGEYLIRSDFGNEKYVEQGIIKLTEDSGLGKEFEIIP
ncbi:dipeptide epimerase [Membranicola marinus]|uniref:Dipeptide epimerase n=1 Tax=Membranihabitans marinus TaxID=1227546 RepID=A0A953HWW1_9BACT|nr:dipeptide epimerase [Membranihabitans marinus]MBY5959268.1 dipeptide epimerase [Membranihabitans marinus]